jgi:hypothetical protein
MQYQDWSPDAQSLKKAGQIQRLFGQLKPKNEYSK